MENSTGFFFFFFFSLGWGGRTSFLLLQDRDKYATADKKTRSSVGQGFVVVVVVVLFCFDCLFLFFVCLFVLFWFGLVWGIFQDRDRYAKLNGMDRYICRYEE